MNKSICIIQPGRLGDLILVLPIAYYYYSQGLDVTWPIANEYIDVFRNVNFLSHMFIYNIGSIDEKGHPIRANTLNMSWSDPVFFNKVLSDLGLK